VDVAESFGDDQTGATGSNFAHSEMNLGVIMGQEKKVRHGVKKASGKTKEKMGRLLNDDDLIVAGKAKQAAASIQETGAKAKNVAKKVGKH